MKWEMDVRNIPEWLVHLEQYEQASARMVEENHYEPLSEDIWIENENDAQFSSGIRAGISLCSIFHEVAFDNYCAFINLLKPEAKPIAAFVCLRSLLEACANILYIYDNSIDLKERYRRSCALEIKNLHERKKFNQTIQDQMGFSHEEFAADIKKCLNRENAIKQQASSLGMVIKDEEIRPGYTKLIEQVLGAKAEYQILSGVSHGLFWSTQVLFFEPHKEMAKQEGLIPDEKTLKTTFIYWGCNLALVSMCRVEWAIWRAHKWDIISLESLIKNTYKNLHFPSKDLPWNI